MSSIRWEQEADGVVVLVLDTPGQSANTLTEAFVAELGTTVARLEAEREALTGVVLTSAKKTFLAGGDLDELMALRPEDAVRFTAHLDGVKSLFRRLELLGVPVVAALNGAAMGGGMEIALACHRRIAVASAQVGLPEVGLGLLPGAGGIVRTTRMLGVTVALEKVLLSGARYAGEEARAVGLVDEVVATVEDLLPAARAWIATRPDPTNPWDRKGFRFPGAGATAASLPLLTAALRKQTAGAPAPAQRAIVAAAVEGSYVDLETASLVETRYLVGLVVGQDAKNRIASTFYDVQAIRAGASRPAGEPASSVSCVAVLGAGMMGAGIAYVAAKAGIDVVLRDVSLEAAQRGKAYAERVEAKAVERGRTTAERSAALLARITPTGDVADCARADLVIEAVFEDVALKHRVLAEVEAVVGPETVLASNTSTLPISVLAQGVQRSADVVGLHFFSPVERMPLVEIIRGEQTSPRTLARAFDLVQQLRKTPIVVNDSRGFFTSRVILARLHEAVALLGEGVPPASIEQAALQSGYPAGPLQLLDELTLTLPRQVGREAEAAAREAGQAWEPRPSDAVLDALIEVHGRSGRSGGAGFYDYAEDGRRAGLWPGLREHFGSDRELPFEDLKERMLFAEVLEALHARAEGVIEAAADGNVGSLLGIGFPAWTGGVLRFVEQYPGGPDGFAARARELAERYGERFTPLAALQPAEA